MVANRELDDAAVEAFKEKYHQEMVIAPLIEIKKFQARMNLFQRELASLMGWSPTTVALYENDALLSLANNNLLKTLINDDIFLSSFICPNRDAISDQIFKKVTVHLADRKQADKTLVRHNTKFLLRCN